jgi:non-ribosomal peptide synthetase component F
MDTGAAGENLREVPSSGSAERKRHQFLVGWNKTAADYPKDKCMHQLFEQRVQENPEAIALVRGAEQLTYGELNRRANRSQVE